jgi:hypothetical protein
MTIETPVESGSIKISNFDRALEEIKRGQLGLNEGLPHGIPGLNDYVPNVQQKSYYLLGASTGCGKTSLADSMFIYSPYDAFKTGDTTYDLDITLYSFEIDIISKIIKGICYKIYKDFNIIVDVNYILSRGKNRISKEIYDKVMLYREYYDQLSDKVTIFDSSINPTGIYKYLEAKAEKLGKIEYKYITTKNDRDEIVKIKVFDKYTPNNPQLIKIFIIDHIALTKGEKGLTNTKSIIDTMSEYSIKLRNNYYYSPVIVQQLSYEINDPIRARLNRLSPMLSDFGDSKYTTRDADFVFSLYSPMTHGQEFYMGYDIRLLGDRFRAVEILKQIF